MMFIFKTTATMKEYNRDKWFIDSHIIPEIRLDADSLTEALEKWREIVTEEHYVEVTKNGMKHKSAMYRDRKDGSAEQIGFVVTGKTEFNDDYRRWVQQYIDLWVEILTVDYPEFVA